MHCVDLGESFSTSIYLQNLASIQPSPVYQPASQPRTNYIKFTFSPCIDPPGQALSSSLVLSCCFFYVRLFYRIREGALLFTIESILHGEERGSPGVPGGPDDVLQLDTSLVVEHPDDDSQSQVSASVQARPLRERRRAPFAAA